MALSFAITACETGWGLISQADFTDTATVAEARDCEGKVVAEKAYSVRHETTARMLVTGTLPTAGSITSYGGRTGLVTQSAINETNTTYQAGAVTIVKNDEAVQEAYS